MVRAKRTNRQRPMLAADVFLQQLQAVLEQFTRPGWSEPTRLWPPPTSQAHGCSRTPTPSLSHAAAVQNLAEAFLARGGAGLP
jgi:hypothetical protein